MGQMQGCCFFLKDKVSSLQENNAFGVDYLRYSAQVENKKQHRAIF